MNKQPAEPLEDVSAKTEARTKALTVAEDATLAWELSILKATQAHTQDAVGRAAGITRRRVGQIVSKWQIISP